MHHDHRRAKYLAEKIAEIAPATINPDHVETNIVGLDLSTLPISAAELAQMAKDEGVLISALGPKYARLVTHLDIDDAAMEFAGNVLSQALNRALMSK